MTVEISLGLSNFSIPLSPAAYKTMRKTGFLHLSKKKKKPQVGCAVIAQPISVLLAVGKEPKNDFFFIDYYNTNMLPSWLLVLPGNHLEN